jgi:type VI secretion system secreted protein VgrG
MQPIYSQFDRPITINTPLGPDALLIVQFIGDEGLNRPYRYELDLACPLGTALAFADLLGQEVTVRLTVGAKQRYFCGVVRRLDETARDRVFTYYRAEVVPLLALLGLRVQSRIFEDRSVPEILKQVLDLPKLKVKYRLSGTYPTRPYTVQYNETDLDFAHRLMQQEGIAYYFEHDADGHTLVLTDQLDGTAGVPVTVVYDVANERPVTGDTLYRWAKSQSLVANQFTTRDTNFQLVGQNLEASRSVGGSVTVGSIDHPPAPPVPFPLEQYGYPGAFGRWAEGISAGGTEQSADLQALFEQNERVVRLLAEEATSQALTGNAETDCPAVAPGGRLQVARHFNANGHYLIESVTHSVSAALQLRAGGGGPEVGEFRYVNQLVVKPAGIPYRPKPSAPKPRIPGLQTATVVGTSGQAITCDKYGRVKVEFAWNRPEQGNSDRSCWVRVGQAWAGNGYGAFFWPRVGHEVLVAYEDGDPDRPVIIGSVYNSANLPPFELPANANTTGIKSCSVGGDPSTQYNWVVFHDQPGSEHVHIHSETHELITSETANFRRVTGPLFHFVGAGLPSGSGAGGGDSDSERDRDCDSGGVGSGGGGGLLDWPIVVGDVMYQKGNTDFITKLLTAFPGSVTTTTGDSLSSVMLGNAMNYTLGGGSLVMMVDPLSMLVGNIGPIASGISEVLLGFSGSSSITMGRTVMQYYYAPSYTINRCTSYTYTADYGAFQKMPTLEKVANVACMAVSGLAAACALGSNIALRVLGVPKPGEAGFLDSQIALLVNSGVAGRLQGLLSTLEAKLAETATAKTNAELALKTSQQAIAICTSLGITAPQAAAQSGLFTVDEAKTALENSLQALADVAGKGNNQSTAPITHRYNQDYTVIAPNLTLNAATNQGNSAINLRADGSGAGTGAFTVTANGSLALRGQRSANAAITSLEINTGNADNSLVINNPTAGEIKISQDQAPTGPNQTFGNNAITLNVGSALGATIKLTATEIKLSVGQTTSLTLGTNSIKLQTAAGSIELATGGITTLFGANTSIKLDAQGITSAIGTNSVNLGPSGLKQDILTLTNKIQTLQQETATTLKKNEEAMLIMGYALGQFG